MASMYVSLFSGPVYGFGFNPDTEGYSHNMTVVILHCQLLSLDSLSCQWKANISLEGNSEKEPNLVEQNWSLENIYFSPLPMEGS